MPRGLYQVDAFTSEAFKGNPAAVCLLSAPKSDAWMQSFAAEMNLSETAYLLPEGTGWRLRWFTPTVEVDLCGHATLASARVLFEIQPELRENVIQFFTRSGLLKARWVNGRVELDFPMMPINKIEVPRGLADVVGFQPLNAVTSGTFFLFEAEDPQDILTARLDMAALKQLPIPEVILTSRSVDPKFDFISRFFAPQLGIDEDPVTGSAHCLLAPYWAEKLGKTVFNAYQASPRGGSLHLRLEGDRVHIRGESVILFKADLLV